MRGDAGRASRTDYSHIGHSPNVLGSTNQSLPTSSPKDPGIVTEMSRAGARRPSCQDCERTTRLAVGHDAPGFRDETSEREPQRAPRTRRGLVSQKWHSPTSRDCWRPAHSIGRAPRQPESFPKHSPRSWRVGDGAPRGTWFLRVLRTLCGRFHSPLQRSPSQRPRKFVTTQFWHGPPAPALNISESLH